MNLYADEVGNPQLPKKFQALKKHSARVRWAGGRQRCSRSRQSSLASQCFLVIGAIDAGCAGKSIAVLPFENRSEDKANAYFADGIQDEILTRLSKIADLKGDLAHIDAALQKRTGKPVRDRQATWRRKHPGRKRAEERRAVRVNVQLIKAANDSHLWADTYDRKLTDIFAVESEIAKAIAAIVASEAHRSGGASISS